MGSVFCCTMRADTGSAPTEDININNINNIIKYENIACRVSPMCLPIFKITII